MFCLAECYSREESKYTQSLELCGKGLKMNESDYGFTIKSRVHIQKGELYESFQAAQSALMINLDNYEALIYHNIIGFQYAAEDKDIKEMGNFIENLEMAIKMFPDSTRLKNILDENEQRFRDISEEMETGGKSL